ncbi:MAG: HlyC/CorC family transporter [Pirellulales bacterium]|nr:HlyC/CorC family transporter [Pirellulales bacterium]
MWLFLLSVFGALGISALCSLMEASLLSLRPSQIADITARRPRIGAIWSGFKDDIERPIAAILILNTAAHTIGASVAGSEFDALYGNKWIWVFSLVFTMLMLQFTEIMPKSAGVRYNQLVAVWIARPLEWLIFLLSPVVHFVHGINRLFGGGKQQVEPGATLEEITALAGLACLSKEISPRQERIIESGTRLSSMKVRGVMRPRVEIEALEVGTPSEEVAETVVESGFSRLPVYKENLDNIVGFVFIKDVLRDLYTDGLIELKKLVRPAPMVPETLPLSKLLQRFHKERTQIAIVLDEHGGTVGLATMEDIVEEFVGEIHDELRRDEPEIVRRDQNSWLVNGATSIRDALVAVGREELRGEIPDDVNVISGLMQKLLDRIPDVGDKLSWNGIVLEVVGMENQRVDRVLVMLEEENPPQAGS